MPEVHRRGWRSRLFTPDSGLPLRPCRNGTKTALDFLRYSADLLRMSAAIRRLVREEAIDLVYANGPRVLPAMIGLCRPTIFHAHSRVDALYARKLIECSLRATSAAIVAASSFVAQHYPSARVIYNCVPDLRGPGRLFRRAPLRIGVLGRIAPEKGQMDFVRAARHIYSAEFIVYGESMFADPAYERAVRMAANGANVHFRGWVNDVGAALRDLDILAVPSTANEAATRVIPEAFSAGTPVVAYPSGGIPEIIDHARTGILTETPSPASLAAAIKRLIKDPDLRARISAEARKEWQKRFRLEMFQSAVCDLIAAHATTYTRLARSARAYGDGAAIVAPEPLNPE